LIVLYFAEISDLIGAGVYSFGSCSVCVS